MPHQGCGGIVIAPSLTAILLPLNGLLWLV
jgi:hypothetical protein